METLCAQSARRGGQVFLLEGPEGLRSAERAASALKVRSPKLRIAGTFAGDPSPRGDRETSFAIRAASQVRKRPIDFLFVAYRYWEQERWIDRNFAKLPVKVVMGVGGAFDFAAGRILRAPKFVQKLGFEWLYRLFREPRRFKRQFSLLKFIGLVYRQLYLAGN
jgi:N-acetylglucosaminyldiphosphoundecaprenol N-acetyl-beta-D-mannosaminyltransferase